MTMQALEEPEMALVQEYASAEVRTKRKKSETRQLNKIVSVRFSDDDLAELKAVADHRGMSVPELLREGGRLLARDSERAAS